MRYVLAKNTSFYKATDNSNYFVHHGIKGQKWGIRRYQNPDGTLTEEGKKRYQLDNKGFFKDKKMANEYSDLLFEQIEDTRKNYKLKNKKAVAESTGKNYDKTHEYIGNELNKFKEGKNSIFSRAESQYDIYNIMGELCIEATLKDLGYKDLEGIKRRMAENPENWEKEQARVQYLLGRTPSPNILIANKKYFDS